MAIAATPVRDLFRKISTAQSTKIAFATLAVLIVVSVWYSQLPSYTIQEGVYAVMTDNVSGHATSVIAPGTYKFYPWENIDRIHVMGTKNTVIVIQPEGRFYATEGLDVTKSVPFPSYALMKTADGNIVKVFYTVWAARNPEKLLALYNAAFEIKAIAQLDAWTASLLANYHDADILADGGRVKVSSEMEKALTESLRLYGLDVVLIEFHFQFEKSGEP